MAELKTKENEGSVIDFLESIEDEQKKEDCFTLLEMMGKLSNANAKMWGSSIVGFGNYHFKYASGREGDWFCIGFSPRKQNISLYVMSGVGKYQDLLATLGKHKTGKGCLYVKRLSDVDITVLSKLIEANLDYFRSEQS